MLLPRYLTPYIIKDLKKKMVFIGGPRQVGKTTLAQQIGSASYRHFAYLNWDYSDDRKKILAERFPSDTDLLVFDELHKYGKWRNYLKGEYDKNKGKYSIVVTGSARLDLYRRGEDSLLGRYHYLRLHPFSLAEILHSHPAPSIFKPLKFTSHGTAHNELLRLMRHGGFPEPLTENQPETTKRFHNERADRLIKEDIRDLERIRDLSALQTLTTLIPERVGALFSINSLKEDLGVTHKTLSLWVDILERFYYHFRIYPYASTKIKSLRKEPKLYLWDWSEPANEGAKFENLIASHLLKFVHFLYDTQGYKAQLNFIRDREAREVDFLVSIDNKPWFAVEAKLSDQVLSPALRYFRDKLAIPHVYQVVLSPDVDFEQNGIRCISASKFLTAFV